MGIQEFSLFFKNKDTDYSSLYESAYNRAHKFTAVHQWKPDA